MPTAKHIWTIGHSNREFDAFLNLLTAESIQLLADVRRFPGSRKYPHFNAEQLAGALEQEGIRYRHFPTLGGRRTARRSDSPNTGWRVEAFNAYADNMQSPEFKASLDELIEQARQHRTAVMCAEAVPWRCHRSLIGDAMLVRGWDVLDIVGEAQPRPHKLTPFASVEGTRITYPAAAEPQDGAQPGLFGPPQ